MALIGFLLSSISAAVCSPPAHLLCFSTLVGTQLYQTFVITKVTFKALPRSPFVRLQGQLFPVYFCIQSLLLFLTAVTFPPHGLLSLLQSRSDGIPFSIGGLAAAVNLVLYGPKTRQAMFDRSQQGSTGGDDKAVDGAQGNVEMASLRKQFSRNHAMAVHLNLFCIGATLWHGWRLAARFV